MSQHLSSPWKWDGDDLWHKGESYSHHEDPHLYLGINVDKRLRDSKHMPKIKALIVASPDLLKACERMRRRAETGKPITVGDVKELEAAIAKAKA